MLLFFVFIIYCYFVHNDNVVIIIVFLAIVVKLAVSRLAWGGVVILAVPK